jgi:hypothetical protein
MRSINWNLQHASEYNSSILVCRQRPGARELVLVCPCPLELHPFLEQTRRLPAVCPRAAFTYPFSTSRSAPCQTSSWAISSLFGLPDTDEGRVARARLMMLGCSEQSFQFLEVLGYYKALHALYSAVSPRISFALVSSPAPTFTLSGVQMEHRRTLRASEACALITSMWRSVTCLAQWEHIWSATT